MQNFDGGKAFQLQLRINRAQRLQHIGVITERQRGMQAADDVQFRDSQLQGLTRLLHNLRVGEFKTVGIALLAKAARKGFSLIFVAKWVAVLIVFVLPLMVMETIGPAILTIRFALKPIM